MQNIKIIKSRKLEPGNLRLEILNIMGCMLPALMQANRPIGL